MATASHRFSIRDYAAKMRIADPGKSWPFAGEKEEKPPLPPISIRRFRWWAHEPPAERSASDGPVQQPNEKIGPQSPKTPKTPTKKRTEDEDLRSPKPKQRAPKKRSIVDLFASAPQIEPAAAAADQWNVLEGDGEGKEQEEKLRKGKRRKVEIRAFKKEKVCKPKMISSGHSHLLQDPIHMKTFGKTAKGFVKSKKKFVKVNTLQKKHYVLQTPNLISGNQELVKKPPVSSILKNKKRFTSARKTRKINNDKTTDFIKRYCKTTRQVTFSGKDDILGHGFKCSSMDLPQFKSLCKVFSDVLAVSSVMNNSSKVHEFSAASDSPQMVNASEKDTNAGVVDRTDASSSQKNKNDSHGNVNHQTIVNSSNRSCSSTEKASFAVMFDLNHAIESINDLDSFNPSTENFSPSCTNSGDLDFRTTHKKGSSTSTEICLGLPKTSLASITPTDQRNFVSTSNATDSLITMKNPSPNSSTSCLIVCNEKNERQRQQYFDTDMSSCHHKPENQSGHYYSPKDLLSNNICYSMGSNKFGGSVFLSNSVSTCKSSTGEDSVSLPLNSQGEFIQMHPGTRFVGPYKKQNNELTSSHGFYTNKQVEYNHNVNHLEIMKEKVLDAASYHEDQTDWCQNQYHPTREKVQHELNFTEFTGPEKPFEGGYGFLHCNANKTKLSFHDCRGIDATPDFFKRVDLQGKCNLDCQLEPVVQPMMRLMGKNVVVGDSNRDWHANWRSGTNKYYKTGQSPSCIVPEECVSNQWTRPELVANTICGNSTGSLLNLSDSPSNFYHMAELEPRFDSHIEKSIGNFYQQNIQQHMMLSSTQCKHSQGVSCGTLVTPQSQIWYHGHQSPSRPVQMQPLKKLPHWLLHAKHQNKNQLFSSPYSDPALLSQPCGFSGTKLVPHLSPYNMPMIPFSVDTLSSAETSSFDPSSSHPSCISVFTATNSISEVTKSNSIEKEREGSHPNFTGFNSSVDAHKFQKRPAERVDIFMDPAKRPYFEKQEDSSIPLEPRGSQLDYADALNIQKETNEMGALRNTEGCNFSRFQNESVVGRTKLIAGAKHLLKPSQKMDDGTCRPIHSNMTFPSNPSSGNFLHSQKKNAKIYKF